LSEQELIEKYFSRHQPLTEMVEVSVGDDAAVVIPPKDSKLVISADTLNAGVHFYQDCEPLTVGHKSLAVSLSDIAAMGAAPLWATLSLSLPNVEHKWLKEFSDGLYSLADTYNTRIVGGDLVKGPLSITVQVIGHIKGNRKLLRNACQLGDSIYVTGYIGDAAYGLKLLQGLITPETLKKNRDYFLTRLQMPKPRLDVSKHIVEYANAAIDISDGFLIDLQRMLAMSNKAAKIELRDIPISAEMRELINETQDIKDLLIGGEDYELIFTINQKDKDKLEKHFATENILITEVGRIIEGNGITLVDEGAITKLPVNFGFDHFS
jgi:thiamine-monophosphate kinase